MQYITKAILYFLPLIFAVGFLAPLTAQVMIRLELQAPFGLTPIAFGLIAAGSVGAIAQLRGRWI